jgi:diguanylate cyclase (GGDEF)-like protein
VDDTPAHLKILVELLRNAYGVLFAKDGASGLALAASKLPDLILLDVMMPDMDGYETLKRLKADPATRSIPVVFLTAKTEAEDESLGLRLGAMDYIPKPFSADLVKARVETQLRIRHKNALLEQLCRVDGLTDLPQRALFEERLAAANSQPLALLLADIDGFGRFNEEQGFGRGDELLRRAAALVASVGAQPDDLPARLGDDAFALLLPGADAERLQNALDALQKGVAALDFPPAPSIPTPRPSCSVGAVLAPAGTPPAALLHAASQALDAARADGPGGRAIVNI